MEKGRHSFTMAGNRMRDKSVLALLKRRGTRKKCYLIMEKAPFGNWSMPWRVLGRSIEKAWLHARMRETSATIV